nr:Ribosome-associated ATPase [Cupriavidus sp.]
MARGAGGAPTVTRPDPPPLPALAQLRNVSHRFGATAALADITLDIPAGQLVGLIGPDGVGKSTLLDLLSGARALQSGAIEVFGVDITDALMRKRIMPRVAYMPQGLGRNMYDALTVAENLHYFGALFGHGQTDRQQRIAGITRATGLHPFLERRAETLSGGMRQKLGLCCALMHDPDLLILDEPTTGVDPLSRAQFWGLLREIRSLRKNISIVVATSIIEEASEFDLLIAMCGGRILAKTTPHELLQCSGERTIEKAFLSLLLGKTTRTTKSYLPFDHPGRHGTNTEVAIEARDLSRDFGGFRAVTDVSFRIMRGEVFGFVGSNGCGKTTTMKMLVGLLPASSGSAYLFGENVHASDRAQRCQVGYMTQTFSLYGELTVRQNLSLHAELFRVPRREHFARIQQMLERFGLQEKSQTRASDLPLGVRQRLSIAVAMVHRPRVLILDEPTSGVDPMARDEIWGLLIDLARNDQVTIFVSTHFMNEAERCDRVALMHDGQVLASGPPSALAQARGVHSLNEAFISILKASDPARASLDPKEIASALSQPVRANQSDFQTATMRLASVALREVLELRHDPVRSTLALVGSLLMVFVIGVGISFDVDGLRFAVLDSDQTVLSQSYAQTLEASPYFARQPDVQSHGELDRRMRTGDVSLVLEIPVGFSRSVSQDSYTEIAAWIDGAMPQRASTIEGYMLGAHLAWLNERNNPSTTGLAGVAMETRYRYNPEVKSINAMVPAVIPMILLMVPTVLAALSVVREKELGSIVNFYVTPISRAEFLVGKQIVYVCLGFLNFLFMCFAGVVILEVPMTGSFFALCLATVIFLFAATGMGLITAVLTRSQIAAIFFSMVGTMIPAAQFAGLINPVGSLEGIGRLIGEAYPASHMFTISRGVFSKAQSLADLVQPITALLLGTVVIMGIAVTAIRKQAV